MGFVDVNKDKDFTGTDFAGIVLDNVKFAHCDFTGADFSSSTLTNVTFYHCSMGGVNFNHATLINVTLWWSYLANAMFDSATLIDLHGQYVDFSNVDFLTADIRNAFIWIGNFKGAKAKPESGFRTRRGGDQASYKIPVISLERMIENGYNPKPMD